MRRLIRPIIAVFALLPAACAAPAPEPAPAPAPPPAATPAPDPATPPQQACTRIGCESGWTVHVAGSVTLPGTYTIRVVADGAEIASVHCSPANPCGEQVFLAGVTVEEADLEIVGAATPLRWTVRPEYNVVQPNGPDCPPTCRQAQVHVRMGS